jgi:hypothetical protein
LIPSSGSDEISSQFGTHSPIVNPPSIYDAAHHMVQKIRWWSDETISATVVKIPLPLPNNNIGASENDSLFQQLCTIDVLIAIGLIDPYDLQYAKSVFETRRSRFQDQSFRQTQWMLDCNTSTNINIDKFCHNAIVGPFDSASPSIQSILFPWTLPASGRRLHILMKQLFQRQTSDDYVLAILLFLNQFSGSSVDWVRHSIDATWEKGPIRNLLEFISMATKCGDCIGTCLIDDSCRDCLKTLTALDTRDQVASYRTIVSYESDILRDFSFCILEKNNIFNCDATIPSLPQVSPITTWRFGQPLTEADGRQILVGHLYDPAAPLESKQQSTSWMVVCGANEAYDQFPSQHQLFYPTGGKTNVNTTRDLWYDPIFQVTTLDGRHVWAKRHYKVRPGGKLPGTFRFSVLDNGITSNEFWTIVGVADDLSWVIFHYAGAASAVGQRYLGGLLCTPDGKLPHPDELDKIWPLFRSAGIEPWELYLVDNNPTSPGRIASGPPPLDHFRSKVQSRLQAVQ